MIIWKLRTHTCHYYGKTHKLINYVKTEKNLLAILYVRVQGAIDTLISTLLTLVWGNLIIEENISNSGNWQVSFKTINPLHAKRYYVNCTLLRRRNEFFFCQKKMFELDLRIEKLMMPLFQLNDLLGWCWYAIWEKIFFSQLIHETGFKTKKINFAPKVLLNLSWLQTFNWGQI